MHPGGDVDGHVADGRREWDRFWAAVAAGLRRDGMAGELAARQGFVLTCAQARECGVDVPAQRRRLRARKWWQPRRGVLAPVPPPRPPSEDPADLHRCERRAHALRAAAAGLVHPAQAISGRSAAVLLGLPTLQVPGVPELTAGPSRTTGRRSRAHLWAASLEPADVTFWNGTAVTTVARTVVDCARHDRRDGLMVADAALRDAIVTAAEIDKSLERATGWPFVRRARSVLALADGRAESPLESLTRLRIAESGLPVPDLQVWIRDPWTGRRYRVDGLWAEQRLVLEVDGRDKYVGQELQREAEREHALRRLGYRVIRVMWNDVIREWPRTLALIRDALAASPPV